MNELVPYSGWAERIAICWRQSAEAIIETGRLIAAAKEALQHGEFTTMVESGLPFGSRTAQMLMAIAADPRLTNPKHVSLLPPHWGTLYELTKLDDQQFDAKVADGTICPDLERKALVNGSRSIMGSRQEPDDSLDYFPTPPWATRALMERVLRPHLGSEPLRDAWEPACGEGHIAEVLCEYFPKVYASDVFDYGYGHQHLEWEQIDFLTQPTGGHRVADWIITNPPFGDLTERFVLQGLAQASVGVAMFVRLQWLESVGRYEAIFRDHPPTIIAFFAERVNLCKGRWEPEGSTATAYIWLVWIRGTKPRAPFWIPPGCRKELTRTDDAERFTAHPVIAKAHAIDASGTPLQHNTDTGEIIESNAAESDGALRSPSPAVAADHRDGGCGRADDEDEPLDLPAFLRRGSPECKLGGSA